MTKAMREKLAAEKAAAESSSSKEKERAERERRDKLERAAAEERRRADAARRDRDRERDTRDGGLDYRGGGDYRDRDYRGGRRDERRFDDRDRRDGPGHRGGRRDDRRGANGAGPSRNGAANGGGDELETIKKRYLGQKEEVKKPWMRKATNKNAIFDWSAADDTSAQPVWAPRPDAPRSAAASSAGSPAPGESKFTDALERRRAGKGGNDDRHWSEKPLSEMKERDWRIFREDYSISSRGGSIPNPLRTWRESAIPEVICDVVDKIGYTEPSPIQRQAIPIGLQNRDLVGLAKTGSGKTAAFLIPILTYISRLPPLNDDNRHLGPYALILAPTRELAQQIEAEAAKFCGALGYTCVSIVGGRSVDEQQFNLRNGAHLVIATPGRLKDMIDKSILVMSQCRYVVMDEADKMVDLGFEADLTFILDAMPPPKEEGDKSDRVMTLFSATMPPAVERLTRKYLRKPATVTIGTAGEAVDTVEQRVEFISGEEKKKARLQDILRNIGLRPPMIVFVNQKTTADVVVKYVQQSGRSATTLHSGKNQEQREASLKALRDGDVEVLVATDLAGRGIDVPDVSLVINWQMTDVIEKYVHRIGRTGRAGKEGLAITFLDNNDEEVMFDLKQEIQKSAKSTMNPELARHEAARQKVTREMKRKRDEFDD
jgi:ATP-dependent RNA helicase DDX23/PRP28